MVYISKIYDTFGNVYDTFSLSGDAMIVDEYKSCRYSIDLVDSVTSMRETITFNSNSYFKGKNVEHLLKSKVIYGFLVTSWATGWIAQIQCANLLEIKLAESLIYEGVNTDRWIVENLVKGCTPLMFTEPANYFFKVDSLYTRIPNNDICYLFSGIDHRFTSIYKVILSGNASLYLSADFSRLIVGVYLQESRASNRTSDYPTLHAISFKLNNITVDELKILLSKGKLASFNRGV